MKLLLILFLLAGSGAMGQTKTLSDLLEPYRGYVVYVDFWASWCGHCLDEMGTNEQWLQQHYAGKSVKFVFVDMDEAQDTAKARQIITGRHIKGVQLSHFDFEMMKWPEGIPTYMLFNMNGELINADAKRPSQAPAVYLQIDSLLYPAVPPGEPDIRMDKDTTHTTHPYKQTVNRKLWPDAKIAERH
jgi:thiol-disulfide isomerase/thioredoxin